MLLCSASYVAAYFGTYAGVDKTGARARAAPLRVYRASAAAVRAAGGWYGEGVDGLLRVALSANAGPFEGAMTVFAAAS